MNGMSKFVTIHQRAAGSDTAGNPAPVWVVKQHDTEEAQRLGAQTILDGPNPPDAVYRARVEHIVTVERKYKVDGV